MKFSIVIFVLVLISFLLVNPLYSADDEDCYICHSDPTLTTEKDGKTVSLFVKEGILKGTVHEDNGCVSCHIDADVEEFPHDTPLQKVDCAMCHDGIGEQYANSSHGRALTSGDKDAPTCVDCHDKHNILSTKNINSPSYIMNIPATCGQCHREDSDIAKRHKLPQQDIIQNYTMSIHGEGLFQGGLIVTAVCSNCHTSHNVLPHTDSSSTINRDNIASTCMNCHAQIERVHQKVIRGELWEKQPHAIPACVDCHSPHKIRRVFYAEEFTDHYCIQCHEKKDLTRTREDGTIDSLYVDMDSIEHSVHGQTISCVKCHTNVSKGKYPVCKKSGKIDCSICHVDVADRFNESIHGK